ncbi:2,3-bisphosphoglycerate-independent phosphoglycerate mutase [Trichinella spiralis]|uniref:2,3-bisphosphoglycerate-independent phosphoglycerate mutase n=1 Tax=Trichinella spiralis TaxID=6334 RepID=A0ABR3K195_TRISP
MDCISQCEERQKQQQVLLHMAIRKRTEYVLTFPYFAEKTVREREVQYVPSHWPNIHFRRPSSRISLLWMFWLALPQTA